MNTSIKKILRYTPAAGFAISALLSLQEAFFLVSEGIPDSVTLITDLLMLITIFIFFFLAYGLVKFEDKTFKPALIISFLFMISLFSNPDIIGLIAVVSGVILLINKKLLHI